MSHHRSKLSAPVRRFKVGFRQSSRPMRCKGPTAEQLGPGLSDLSGKIWQKCFRFPADCPSEGDFCFAGTWEVIVLVGRPPTSRGVYSLAMTRMRFIGVTLLIASLPLSAQASKMKLEEFLRLTPSTTATGGAAAGHLFQATGAAAKGSIFTRRTGARRMQAPLARPPLNISSSARRLRARYPTSTCWASTT